MNPPNANAGSNPGTAPRPESNPETEPRTETESRNRTPAPNPGTGLGRVDLVGAGPGDPLLITLRGARALARADVVVHDHLAPRALLDLAPPAAERVDAGKRVGNCNLKQDDINRLLVERARAGLRVVRLKGGDPFVFGRGAEEAAFLRNAGIPHRVVPGVTAALAASALAGIPLTHRDAASAVALVTGHRAPEASPLDWNALARFPGTLVLYMAVGHLAEHCRALLEHGKPPDTPAAAVQSAATPRQRVVLATLRDLPERARLENLAAPAIVVVGEVVSLRQHLQTLEDLPLFGRRILVTRPRPEPDPRAPTPRLHDPDPDPDPESEDPARPFEELGAEVLVAPLLRILPVEGPDREALDAAVAAIPRDPPDWIAFTSANGVRHFLDAVHRVGRDLRVLGPVKIAAVGPATARALRDRGLRPDLVPERRDAEGLADALAPLLRATVGSPHDAPRVLVVRPDRGRDVLQNRLAAIPGVRVRSLVAYRNADAPPETLEPLVREHIRNRAIDWIALTSPAAARNLAAILDPEARSKIGNPDGAPPRIAAISPLTAAAALEFGWNAAAVPPEPSWPGLVRAVLDAENRIKPRDDDEPTTRRRP